MLSSTFREKEGKFSELSHAERHHFEECIQLNENPLSDGVYLNLFRFTGCVLFKVRFESEDWNVELIFVVWPLRGCSGVYLRGPLRPKIYAIRSLKLFPDTSTIKFEKTSLKKSLPGIQPSLNVSRFRV